MTRCIFLQKIFSNKIYIQYIFLNHLILKNMPPFTLIYEFSDMEMSDFEKVKIFNPSNPTQLLEIYRFKDSRGNAKRGEIVPNLAKPERCPVRIIDYYLEKRWEIILLFIIKYNLTINCHFGISFWKKFNRKVYQNV